MRVVNRGFSIAENKWKEAEGKAYFVRGQDEGSLKVSLFGSYYGSYVVFGLDKENYQHAFVTGPNTSYLWLLSRTTTVRKELVDYFVQRSKDLGINIDSMICVEHNPPNPES